MALAKMGTELLRPHQYFYHTSMNPPANLRMAGAHPGQEGEEEED